MKLGALASGLTTAPGRRSRAADWYHNRGRLVGVCRNLAGKRSLELLAHGLQGLDGRALELVVPTGAVPALRARSAWLDAEIRIHPFQGKGTGFDRIVGPVQTAMSPSEACQFYDKLGGLSPTVDLDPSFWPSWLLDVASSLEDRGVQRSQTTRSVVWRYRGRQVLAVRPARSGTLALIAGADFTSSGSDRSAPFRRTITAGTDMAETERDELRTAIDTAIERRRNGEDHGHRERLLQATISSSPDLIGLAQVRREVPAWRPKYRASRGRASIDLLGCDPEQGGHVIEVKIRPDAQLGMQALDYWAWVNARRAELAEDIGADPGRTFQLDLVLGGEAAEEPAHPAAAATLEALAPDVNWRCHIVTNWDTIEEPTRPLTPAATAVPPRQLPESRDRPG